jgi:hypothetical protein
MLGMLHSRQYKGGGTEDPHSHIDFFDNICGKFKNNAFTEDEVRLKIFSQILVENALSWYKSHSPRRFDSLKELSSAFLFHFYLERKSDGARRMITNFKNRPGERLLNSYVRFHKLLDYFPHHEFPSWLVLHVFYGGLSSENIETLDQVSRGVFMKYTIDQAWELFNDMRMNK